MFGYPYNHHVTGDSASLGVPGALPPTPFADALQRLTARGWSSLHALPASSGHSLEGSAFRQRYIDLFGEAFLRSDITASGSVLDSFFRPRSCLATAQNLASRAFGSDETLFLTCGTTVTNTVAVNAFIAAARADRRPFRALVDRTCHQSVHFALHEAGAEISYSKARTCGSQHSRTWVDLDDIVARYVGAIDVGMPFDLVVLSSGSYDGAVLDLRLALRTMLQAGALRLLVDEAWTAIHAFHPRLRATTALAVAGAVVGEVPEYRLDMMVTHSAHKSMSALRQGSYLHVLGSDELRKAARASLYRHHTTSPSLPVLASLDLARAQAELEGAVLVERSVGFVEDLTLAVNAMGPDAPFRLARAINECSPWVVSDPMVLVLDVVPERFSAKELQLRLARDYGIYLARTTGGGVVMRVHIGVTSECSRTLLKVLEDMSQLDTKAAASEREGEKFLVAYPPGIPLLVPGEQPPHDYDERTRELRLAGAEFFSV